MAVSLANIVTGVRVKPPKLTLYGVGGIGKTTWAAGAPNPIFLFTEEGQGTMDVARFEIRAKDPVLRSWEELMECVQWLHGNEHPYETLVIDTIDFAEPLLHKYTAAKWAKDGIEGFGYGKGYTYAVDEFRILTDWLEVLRNERGMTVILIAHSQHKKFEAPDSESYDMYQLRLHERLGAYVHDWSDAVLFANYRAHIVKDEEGFNRERKRAVGLDERIVYTTKRPAFVAKNRYGLPAELELSWAAFQNAIVIPESKPQPKPQPKKKEN